jgi:peptidylprolyl isomerase
LATAIPGIAEALKLMVTDEKRRMWIPAELVFATHVAHHGPKEMHEHAAPPVDLTADIQLIQILKAPAVPENLNAPPPKALRTASGVTLQILKAGTSTEHPSMSSRVTLNYSGWTMDGKLFESTMMSGHPAAVLVGTALPGWREALLRMVTGEKARVWIPAALAYGNHPVERMAPAGDLVYDIELLDFK